MHKGNLDDFVLRSKTQGSGPNPWFHLPYFTKKLKCPPTLMNGEKQENEPTCKLANVAKTPAMEKVRSPTT